MKQRVVPNIVSVVCMTLLIAGVLFWPTLYRYERLSVSGTSVLLRINRITGCTEQFRGAEWRAEKRCMRVRPLPGAELAKLTGRGSIDFDAFKGSIYNGSAWTIAEVTFWVRAKGKVDGKILWSRRFMHDLEVRPLRASDFSVKVIETWGEPETEWDIESAAGYPGQ